MIILLYWIISGLIVFSLTQPTVFVFDFPLRVFGEFLLCMLLGGFIVPILAMFSFGYWIKVLFFEG